MIVLQSTQAEILKVMQAVASTPDTKQHSILTNAKIEKDGNLLSVTGANSEMAMTVTSYLGGEAGSFEATVPVRKLVAVLQSLPSNEAVTLESKDGTLILWSQSTNVLMNTLPAATFSAIQFAGTPTAVFKLPQLVLRELIEQVAFAMPSADTREYLNGACLRISQKTATLVATDKRKIAMAVVDIEASQHPAEVILPRRSVLELQRWFGSGSAMVEVHLTDRLAKFSTGGMQIVTKLLSGKFPDFSSLWSAGPITKVDVPRDALLSSLRRAIVMAKENFTAVHVVLTKNMLTLTGVQSEFGISFDEINVRYTGIDVETSFDAKYLFDAVSNIESHKVILALGPKQAHMHMTKPGTNRFLYVAAQLRI